MKIPLANDRADLDLRDWHDDAGYEYAGYDGNGKGWRLPNARRVRMI